jgi:chromosome segregation ATPase
MSDDEHIDRLNNRIALLDNERNELRSRLSTTSDRLAEVEAELYKYVDRLDKVAGLIRPWATHCDYRAEDAIQEALRVISGSAVERRAPLEVCLKDIEYPDGSHSQCQRRAGHDDACDSVVWGFKGKGCE